jgi:phosphate starvation-inducible membrane PsiE
LWKTFDAWFKTGSQGAGHEKETYYWLELIVRYEQPLGLGLLVCVACQYLRHVGLRYLAIYGVGTLLAYSIVKYKTPWCIISIAWPLLFMFAAVILLKPFRYSRLAAIAVAWLVSAFLVLGIARFVTDADWNLWHALWVPLLISVIILSINLIITLRVPIMAGLLAISLALTVSLNYFRCTTFNEFNWNWDRNVFENVAQFYRWEPYVYVQTYNDVWKLTRPLLRLAKANPTYYQLIGHLIRTSTYPLPWMLGDFTKVGYYEHNNMPEKLDGDFLLVQEDKIQEVEAKLQETYYTDLLTIRPYQDYSKLYFNARVFSRLFPGRVPEFTGKRGAVTPDPAR